MKTEVINTRVEPALKRSVAAALKPLGVSTTEAITMFLHQVVMHKGIPFDVRVPNARTQKALKNALDGKNLTTYKSLDDLKREFR